MTRVLLAGIIVAAVFGMVVPASAEEDPVQDPPIASESAGDFVDAVGTYFEVESSTYLDITLTSTEEVHVYLESSPRMVSLLMESTSTAASTDLTFSGFEPNTMYYRYQDGYLAESFTTDANGAYTYTQDISVPHHIFIQEEESTIYILHNGSVWPPTAPISVEGNIYTFTDNISNKIVVQADSITIDGNGYTLQGSGSGYGFYLNWADYVTIKNTKIDGFTTGINLIYSGFGGNSIMNNTVSNCRRGINLHASGTSVTNNTVLNNRTGIDLYVGNKTQITDNTVLYNTVGIELNNNSDNNLISSNTFSLNSTGILLNENADSNYIVSNAVSRNGRGIQLGTYFWGSGDNNSITNNIITGCYFDYGIILWGNSNNTSITNNTISNINNREGGIFVKQADNLSITNNIITGNYGGINSPNSGVVISHNDVWGNIVDYHRCSPGPGDISLDPLFVDPGVGDYHLQVISPCVDSGTNDTPDLPDTDFDGNPRVVDGDGDEVPVVDMGALESRQRPIPWIPFSGATVSLDNDYVWLASNFVDPDDGDLFGAAQWQVTKTSRDYSDPIIDGYVIVKYCDMLWGQ